MSVYKELLLTPRFTCSILLSWVQLTSYCRLVLLDWNLHQILFLCMCMSVCVWVCVCGSVCVWVCVCVGLCVCSAWNITQFRSIKLEECLRFFIRLQWFVRACRRCERLLSIHVTDETKQFSIAQLLIIDSESSVTSSSLNVKNRPMTSSLSSTNLLSSSIQWAPEMKQKCVQFSQSIGFILAPCSIHEIWRPRLTKYKIERKKWRRRGGGRGRGVEGGWEWKNYR